MSQYYKQMQSKTNEAQRLLDQRLARKDMGDKEYEKMIAHSGDRTFRIVGLVLIALFGAAILAVVAFGY